MDRGKPIDLDNYEERSGIRNNRWGLNSLFSTAELDRALKSSRDKSSPGLDGIDYKMLKLCPNTYKDKILEGMNFSFANGYMF